MSGPKTAPRLGERVILEMIDWETSGDPWFYENRHTPPVLIEAQPGGEEHWIFYNTTRFSGKRLVVKPGGVFTSKDAGVYSVFVWKGSGEVGGHDVKGGDPTMDELLVSHSKATAPMEIRNSGSEVLELIKFFGPDINARRPSFAEVQKALARLDRRQGLPPLKHAGTFQGKCPRLIPPRPSSFLEAHPLRSSSPATDTGRSPAGRNRRSRSPA